MILLHLWTSLHLAPWRHSPWGLEENATLLSIQARGTLWLSASLLGILLEIPLVTFVALLALTDIGVAD